MVGRLGVLESKLWLGKTTDGEVKPVYLTKRNSLTTDLRYAMEITEDNAKYFSDWEFKPFKIVGETDEGIMILEARK